MGRTAMLPALLVGAAICVLASLPAARGSVVAGFLVGRQFAFLGKFCFSWKPTLHEVAGRIAGEIETNVNDLQVAIYDDEALFWNYIMTDPSCDCRCKTSRRHTKHVFNVTGTSGALDIPFDFSFNVHQHIRPRFWYVALARCVPGGDEYHPAFTQITEESFRKYYFSSWYELHFTQADGGELPVQQEGLPVVYGIMAALSAVTAAAQAVSARAMRQSESFHPIVKLLTLVVGFFFATNALLCLHFVAFEFNGIGVPFFNYSAKIMQVFVRVGTILLAMLVAKGWTITSVTLHGQETLSCLMITILGLYLSMAMWYLVWLDPASTLYIYESWPGVGICAIQLAVLAWFGNTLFETRSYEEAKSKRRFFLQIGGLFALYMIALPITVLIASFLSPWVREKTVAAISTSVDVCVYAALVYILWPSRAPHFFERLYSVSTSGEKTLLREQNLPTEEL